MRFLGVFLAAGLIVAAPVAAHSPAQPPPSGVAGAPAQPQPEPTIARPGDWVEPAAMGTPDPALSDRAAQLLLSNSQSRYGTDHIEHYLRLAFLIQNAQALQSLGTISIPWNPALSDVVVHKVQIIRNGQLIDLLANGHHFTVLRRGEGLESAMLDGTLTAVMQAEGLAVGDIIDISWTVRIHAGSLPLRAENYFAVTSALPIRHLSIRQTWADGLPVRWRGTGAFEHAQARTTSRGTILSVDLTDAVLPQPAAQMPARLMAPATLQLTQYRDWAELSDMLGSHYRDAATLAPDSPLRAEIARIAAASQDPAVRAMSALRLVQDQVRYFALMLGEGDYLPAGADESWARRYADCKGKAVLLVALLQGLGVEADAVAVNSENGESLNDRMPMMPAFNHVIVRARINGHSYWLDGTRSGDRMLDDLAFSTFGWGLPIRVGGAALEQLPFGPPVRPLVEANIVYDGSGTGGLNGPVPTHTEFVMRGDSAVQMRQSLSQLGRDAFLRAIREQASANPMEGFTVSNVDLRDDADGGTFALIISGQKTLDWQPVPGTAPAGGPRRLMLEQDVPNMDVGTLRPDGPFHDTPVALPVPLRGATTETVILPNGGRGFSIDGRNVEQVIAGTRFIRQMSIADGRLTARWEAIRVAREISAADARASTAQLRELRDDKVYLRAPPGLIGGAHAAARVPVGRAADGSEARAAGREPVSAQEFNQRGYVRLQAHDLDGADADFARAATINTTWSRPVANRAIVRIHREKYEEAETFIAQAAALDANDFVVHQARGLIHMARNRPIQAIVEFSRTLELDPGNDFTLFQRASAYQQVGEFDDALTDLAAIVSRTPGNLPALASRARIHAWRGESDMAVADADAIVALDPRNPLNLFQRAVTLKRIGRADVAATAFAEALSALDTRSAATPGEAAGNDDLRQAILAESGQSARAISLVDAELARRAGDPQLLNRRCWIRATANIELPLALADCEQAVARSPANAAILDSRAFVRLRMGQYDAAIADEDAALSHSPNLPAALYTRGIARLRKGDREAGERDLAAARRLVFDIDASYRAYGVTP